MFVISRGIASRNARCYDVLRITRSIKIGMISWKSLERLIYEHPWAVRSREDREFSDEVELMELRGGNLIFRGNIRVNVTFITFPSIDFEHELILRFSVVADFSFLLLYSPFSCKFTLALIELWSKLGFCKIFFFIASRKNCLISDLRKTINISALLFYLLLIIISVPRPRE